MRTLAITQNITLDGSIEMLGDWFDPSAQDPDLIEETRLQSEKEDALLLGRQTFEDFRGYWPQQTDDQTGITDELNQVQKYVVSSTMTDPEWQNSTILSGDWAAQVRELKEREGGEIGVTGSITLCHALMTAGLADELRLFIYPVVQGRGRRLFPDGHEVPRLELLEAKRFGNDVGYLRYAM
jgi:dihydrofolate reductase